MILKRFGWNEKAFQALNERPNTWAHIAVLQVVVEEDLVSERLQVALDFHWSVSDQAAAHLSLLYDNTFRTPWLAAKLLSTEKALANSSAAALVRHLVTPSLGTRPLSRITCLLERTCGRTSKTLPRQSLQCSCGETRASM